MKTSEAASLRAEAWRELIQRHKNSGLSVDSFCQQHGVSSWSFYQWRKRLGTDDAVRFALVETGGVKQPDSASIEICLGNGDRLQIAPGVDATTLRTVLAVLRECQ
jgi:transposase-like protein